VWTDLGGGILVRQSSAFWMNTLLLLDPGHTVVIDPGVLPGELDDIAARVADRRPEHVTLVFSHAHWDHVLGRPWWPGARTIAHARFAAELREHEAVIGREAEFVAAARGEVWRETFHVFEPDLAIEGERAGRLGPWGLVLRDAPGHCASQITAQLPAAHLLFAADMLSDIEIPILDGPPAVYIRTLRALTPVFESGAVATLVPGHGSPATGAEPAARLKRDLDYLERLESGVRDAAARGRSLAEIEIALGHMEYVGKTAEYSMRSVHLANVHFAHAALAGA
jgi:glyoxylase-like metal-dependent hydrolase (beta-lactamase superfamily II)